MTLYVAGDSFASLDSLQPVGESWSEIVADKLSTNLINVARPGASNTSIAIQLDWIYNKITPDDKIIIFLTDHLRISMIKDDHKINPNISLLEQHSTFRTQRITEDIYKESNIISASISNPSSDLMNTIFEKSFDPLLQYFIDTHVIIGMITKLYTKTSNFSVIQGSFGMRLGKDFENENFSDVLLINHDNYLPLNTNFIIGQCFEISPYMNHLDKVGHAKLGNLVYSKLS